MFGPSTINQRSRTKNKELAVAVTIVVNCIICSPEEQQLLSFSLSLILHLLTHKYTHTICIRGKPESRQNWNPPHTQTHTHTQTPKEKEKEWEKKKINHTVGRNFSQESSTTTTTTIRNKNSNNCFNPTPNQLKYFFKFFIVKYKSIQQLTSGKETRNNNKKEN